MSAKVTAENTEPNKGIVNRATSDLRQTIVRLRDAFNAYTLWYLHNDGRLLHYDGITVSLISIVQQYNYIKYIKYM